MGNPIDQLITFVGFLAALGGGTLVGLAYASLALLLGADGAAVARGALALGTVTTALLVGLLFGS